MTLLVRDEADVIDAQLAFHLNAGVALAIVTDHRSSDGTSALLERHARNGSVVVIREEREEYLESEYMTRMARLAATEFGADWVINSAADEFWWPRGPDLEAVLSVVPSRYGVVHGIVRNFIPRPDDGGDFAERMTLRLAPTAPINDPTSPWRPYAKVVHRAYPRVVVARGSHALLAGDLLPLRGWSPIEVLHFGIRSPAQSARKAAAMWTAFSDPAGRGRGTTPARTGASSGGAPTTTSSRSSSRTRTPPTAWHAARWCPTHGSATPSGSCATRTARSPAR